MEVNMTVSTARRLSLFVALATTWAWAVESGSSLPVSTIVSVEAKHGKDVPVVYREDVRVLQNSERRKVQEWIPVEQAAGLQLFLLIDDSSDSLLGAQFDDLKTFVAGLSASTAIGVGYIRNGSVEILQHLEPNHALAGKTLRLPRGEQIMASPYLAITELIKTWPASTGAREILLLSSGEDALQPGSVDTYLDDAIERAQRAGVQIYSVYVPPSGHAGHTYWRLNWGQANLSKLADETGGEAYFLGFQMPVALAPYLDQISDRLKHQYLLTFLAKADNKAGYQQIRVETEVPNAELVAPRRVYIPAAR